MSQANPVLREGTMAPEIARVVSIFDPFQNMFDSLKHEIVDII